MSHQHNISHHETYSLIYFVIALVVGFALHELYPTGITSNGDLAIFLGTALGLLGTVILFVAKKARKPLYSHATKLHEHDFRTSIYKYSRHPGYLGMFLMLIGLALLINSLGLLVSTLLLFLIFQFLVIPREEKILIKACGPAYSNYCKHVRMWF